MVSLRPKRVTVIGNYSGRNAGDAALLGGLLRDVTERYPYADLRFEVPTIKPSFIRETYPDFPVRPVGLLPWNLSAKILGVPIVRSVLGADLVLVTDAILFDRKLYNPLFNYLHTLSWVLPLAARRGVPVVLYNVALGVVHTEAGRRCLRRVLQASTRVIVRESASAALARELDPDGPEPILGADCALSSDPAPEAVVDAIAAEQGVLRSDRPVLGFNVNRYLDAFMGAGGRKKVRTEAFQGIVAAVLDRAVRELGVQVLMVQTYAGDAKMADGVLARVREREHVGIVRNPPLDYAALTGFLGRAEALVGMRTHTLILGARMGVPVGGIIAYPKTTGYLESIDCGDMILGFSDFDEDALWDFVREVWTRRHELAGRLAVSVPRERAKAARAADELAPWLSDPVDVFDSADPSLAARPGRERLERTP